MDQGIGKAECPFSAHGEELLNVKFFRGRRDDVITAGEIIGEARSARLQHRSKAALISRAAPASEHPMVNVREFVEAL
ncbi:hypothetical protein ACMGDH_05760 [Sphingomonas sp. DT-207]|uniref:hypothetical protein n=1 Tax=Sphingomonas sp. DT-207 TaxID=3396167 RepID=UPI003F1D1890